MYRVFTAPFFAVLESWWRPVAVGLGAFGLTIGGGMFWLGRRGR